LLERAGNDQLEGEKQPERETAVNQDVAAFSDPGIEAVLINAAGCGSMLKEYLIPMPNQSLTDAEIRQYLKYFHWIDAQPPGSVKASAGGH
jgi:hypothetical protein